MKYRYSIPVIASTALLLISCGGGASGTEKSDHDRERDRDNDNGNSTSAPNSPVNPGTPSEGRLLAAQCAQCHGTDGISKTHIDSLAGEGGEILEELVEMQNKNKNEVMHLQAKGYSYSQIVAIANYYNGISSNGGNNNGNNDNDNEGDD